MRRRIWLSGIVLIVIVLGIGGGYTLLNDPQQEQIPNNPVTKELTYPINETLLDELSANRQSGGVPVDGIPAIEDPVYVDVSKADSFLADNDIVFGLIHNGEILAFPQKILVWHEIVNDIIGGEHVSITYCPLTGSSIAYRGEVASSNTTFGTSGELLNSNLVMYDRESSSFWPQIFSQAISGEERGVRLERLHVTFTEWALWKAAFPDSLVLSTNTGYTRNYDYDPYGSYNVNTSYYQQGGPYFPVMYEDDRLQDKQVVIGIDVYSAQYAVEKKYLREFKVLNLEVGSEKVAVFYDEVLDDVRVFSRNLNGTSYTFYYENGGIFDQETGGSWSRYGTSLHGQLYSIDSFDVMWYSWFAFYPNTGLICYGCS